MRLTTYTDYTLRVLIYLGLARERLATIEQIAAAYGISQNHLMKVVHALAQAGYVETVRGKGGGMRLARAPESIRIAEVVRASEDGFDLVECFPRDGSDCRIERACVLRAALREALGAFFSVLERYTLADLLAPSPALGRALALPAPQRQAGRSAGARQLTGD